MLLSMPVLATCLSRALNVELSVGTSVVSKDYTLAQGDFSYGLLCSAGAGFPAQYNGSVFIAEHGSWARETKIGYRVVALMFAPNGTVINHEVFVEGFLERNQTAWGELKQGVPETSADQSQSPSCLSRRLTGSLVCCPNLAPSNKQVLLCTAAWPFTTRHAVQQYFYTALCHPEACTQLLLAHIMLVDKGRAVLGNSYSQTMISLGRVAGRPVDVEVSNMGLLISDDQGGAVYRVAYNTSFDAAVASFAPTQVKPSEVGPP